MPVSPSHSALLPFPDAKMPTAEQVVGIAEQVVGIDEAGRGCLAGPVVAAAVILPPAYDLPGLGDSKALSAAQRATLAPAIRQCALGWGLGVVWQRDIDRVNILQATFLAMSRAVGCLRRHPPRIPAAPALTAPTLTAPTLLLVDGNKTIPLPVLSAYVGGPLPHQRAIVGGDAREPAISAASILAKTFRDRLMDALHRRYPRYGFLRHKGYGTREHLAALRQYGPCPLHRMTFAGVLPPPQPTAPPGQGALL